MKLIVFFALLVVTLSSANRLADQWTQFKSNHGKTYRNHQEELKRLEIFNENLKEIERHNELFESGQSSFKKGVNQFADLTREEFVEYLKTFPRPTAKTLPTKKFQKPLGRDVPDSKDWRDEGAVGAVKNQGSCGSCWAFSTTGSLEGQEFLTTGNLIPLSEQELVDCSKEGGNGGCAGGSMLGGFEYVEKNGIVSEDDYPYEAADESCKRGDIPATFKISSHVRIAQDDENELKTAVGTVGPVSVAVDASTWQLYASGVLDECENNLNHGVLAVGYGQEGNGEIWIVKNSWGEGWGEQGFIRTKRNRDNQCGIATDASYPVV